MASTRFFQEAKKIDETFDLITIINSAPCNFFFFLIISYILDWCNEFPIFSKHFLPSFDLVQSNLRKNNLSGPTMKIISSLSPLFGNNACVSEVLVDT